MKNIWMKLIPAVLAAAMLATGLAACGNGTSTASGTSSAPKLTATAGVLKLGFDPEFPPMGFRENGQYKGFDIDMATEVCKRLGWKLTPVPINWDNKVQLLNDGTIDCVWNGFTIDSELKKQVLYSEPYMDNAQALFVLDSSPYKSKADLKGKVVATQQGSSSVKALNADPEFKASVKPNTSYTDFVKAMAALDAGQAQALLMDETMANYQIKKLSKPYRALPEKMASEQYGIGFKLGNTALKDKIEAQLGAMVDDGTVATISTKWFGKDVTAGILPK